MDPVVQLTDLLPSKIGHPDNFGCFYLVQCKWPGKQSSVVSLIKHFSLIRADNDLNLFKTIIGSIEIVLVVHK